MNILIGFTSFPMNKNQGPFFLNAICIFLTSFSGFNIDKNLNNFNVYFNPFLLEISYNITFPKAFAIPPTKIIANKFKSPDDANTPAIMYSNCDEGKLIIPFEVIRINIPK